MSHGLSARRARRTKSRGPKGLQLEVGARRAPRLLVAKYNPNWNQWLPVEETDNGLRLNGVYQSQKINLSPRNYFFGATFQKVNLEGIISPLIPLLPLEAIFLILPCRCLFICFEGCSPVSILYLFEGGSFLFVFYICFEDATLFFCPYMFWRGSLLFVFICFEGASLARTLYSSRPVILANWNLISLDSSCRIQDWVKRQNMT